MAPTTPTTQALGPPSPAPPPPGPPPAAPAPASPPPRPATPRGRALRWTLWSALALLLLLAALVGGIGWVATTQPGVQWGLGRVPGLQVEGLQGNFGGGPFAAKRLHYRQGDLEITIDDLRWRDLRWRLRPREGSLAGLVIEAPSARRVELRTAPATTPGEPAQPPASLRLPVELELRQAAIDELRIDDQAPLTALRAELLHLGQDNGLLHRVRGLQANREGLAVAADGSIGSIAPMAVELQARVRNPVDAGLPWLAELNAKGPLARLEFGALWHGAPVATGAPAAAAAPAAGASAGAGARDPGTLRIDATLTPFATWPLAALVANAQALDLSAFDAALPRTQLAGSANARGSGVKEPLQVELELRNALPGRLDAGRLPIEAATLLLRGVPSDLRTVEFERLQLQLADGPAADADGTAGAGGATARSGAASTRHAAGRIDGSGRWHGDQLELSLQLDGVRPDRLDSRAAPMTLAGPLRLAVGGLPAPDGTPAPAGSARVATLGGELDGALAQNAGGTLPRTRLEIDAQAEGREGAWTVEVGKLVARAADASARGSARIELAADGAWRLRSSGKLDRFDPRPWFPGAPGSAWRRGPHRLDADWKLDLAGAATAPVATTAAAVATPPTPKPTQPTQPPPPPPPTTTKRADASPFDALLALRGEAALDLRPSQLAGVPLRGKLALRNPAGAAEALLDLDLRAADNHIVAAGRLRHARDAGCRAAGQHAAAACFSDRWQLDIDAPKLAQLRPIVALHPALADHLPSAGAAQAKISAVGRWPLLRSEGTLQASGVKAGAVELGRIDGRWRIGSDADAPLELRLDGASLAYGANRLTSLQARVDGSLREQRFELDATTSVRPPAWVDSVDVRRASDREAAAAATAPTVAQASPVAVAATEQGTRLRVAGSGRFDPQQRLWQGTLAELRASDRAAPQPAWLAARELRPSLRFDADGGLREALLQSGQLELLGAPLRWREARWQAATGGTGAQPARLDLDAELAPLRVAPWLARFQPDLRWGGDLAVGGRAVVRSAAQFDADVVIERSGGDLTITDETGTESLGLTDLRLALAAHGGTWYFTQAVAGANLGVLAGSQVLRVPASSSWPAPTTPLEGVLEWRVDNLAVWAPWVPASWRLGGKLRTSAAFGGSFGAPQLTGEMAGAGLSARNLLEGIDLRDGDLAITLRGETARIERLRLRGGDGELVIGGGATLGAAPRAQLQIDARRFQLLGRLDRRIIGSGRAELRFDADALKLDGSFAIDEGLFDFTRSDAPSLDSDIVVVRRRGEAPRTPDQLAAERAKAAPPPKRSTDVQLRVDLGDKLLLRGRGIDTRLRGNVAISTPQGRLAVNGAVRTEGGTYAAYGQKLEIRRGVVAFSGVPDNPRLDIVAVRPNLDVDVGVAVSGSALNPRVRLFSEPDMNDMDKLSWLLLGRAPDGLGRNDSALLQRAAMALMAGEGASKTDELIKRLGLDEISVRQTEASGQTAGETIVSLGKQISSRLYLGYEHGVNSATGNWQLIYRIAQRLTLRAQAGSDSAIDVIRSWRWN